ncbi:hypothetical protein AJ80_06086 [Polytolypa hystricis UAMH7299]|uniref:Uncharacterized protein n=1 Tax=Polytolypa hystricis (strain UAMH7299) TaxID=1447883 RepID=A0A2B7XZN2_POLH7|nr:hypothetical protein AJ80_06086 [Polytolypa hystricis UAMH7299]
MAVITAASGLLPAILAAAFVNYKNNSEELVVTVYEDVEFGQILVPVELMDFDHIIIKEKLEIVLFTNWTSEIRTYAWADCNVGEPSKDDSIPLECRGYYDVDRVYHNGQPAVLLSIPTGKSA